MKRPAISMGRGVFCCSCFLLLRPPSHTIIPILVKFWSDPETRIQKILNKKKQWGLVGPCKFVGRPSQARHKYAEPYSFSRPRNSAPPMMKKREKPIENWRKLEKVDLKKSVMPKKRSKKLRKSAPRSMNSSQKK